MRLFKKVPYSVMPSVSEASLALFGMTKKGGSGRRPGMSSRGAQALRDPSADASGRQKKGVRGDKKGGLGATAERLAQKHS
jgi:hypothetical protein